MANTHYTQTIYNFKKLMNLVFYLFFEETDEIYSTKYNLLLACFYNTMENNQIEYFGMFFTSHCTFETNIYDKEEFLFHW